MWTTNASQGLGAQVVVAGNLTYHFGQALTVGAGIASLPTTRSTQQTFPFWLKVDSRTVADEYFRGSFTTGVFLLGSANSHLHYEAMLGNNLSQLGVDAGQLDMGLRTLSSALWMTTSNFKPFAGYGDFNEHEHLGAMLGTAYTVSREDKESQPGTQAPDNSQMRSRMADESSSRVCSRPRIRSTARPIRWSPPTPRSSTAAFRWRVRCTTATSARQLRRHRHPANQPADRLGFRLQASAMLRPKLLMLYGYTSRVFGNYGNPWDFGVGLNYYPFKSQVFRANAEVIVVDQWPVGDFQLTAGGGENSVMACANLELLF